MKNLFAAFIALLLPVLAAAQLSVSGKVTDQQTGAALPGATITIGQHNVNAVADAAGNYRIRISTAGNYMLKVIYIGYQTVAKNVVLNADTLINFQLDNSIIFTEEVTVSGTRASKTRRPPLPILSKKDIAEK